MRKLSIVKFWLRKMYLFDYELFQTTTVEVIRDTLYMQEILEINNQVEATHSTFVFLKYKLPIAFHTMVMETRVCNIFRAMALPISHFHQPYMRIISKSGMSLVIPHFSMRMFQARS